MSVHKRLIGRRVVFGIAGTLALLVSFVCTINAGASTNGMYAVKSRQPSQRNSGVKPTIVLVHGAWADSSSWDAVIQRLTADGYTAVAEPNPLDGLAADSAYLADFLASIKGPIVLVGHSYGGAVITNTATGDPNVKALVYVDAFIPDQGETLLHLIAATPGSCLANPDPAKVFNVVPYPGAPKGDYELYVKPSLFELCFANNLPKDEAVVLAATQRPLVYSAATAAAGMPAWKTIPSWAVIGTADHAIPPAEQLFMAERAHAHITEVDAPHLSMISSPGTVTKVILQAVDATT